MAKRKGNYHKTILFGVCLMINLTCPSYSFPICQLDISRFKDDLCRRHYDSRLCNSPSLQGNFASDSDCQKAKYQFCGGRGDPFCMSRVACVQCDFKPVDPPPPQASSSPEEPVVQKQELPRPKMDYGTWNQFKNDALRKDSTLSDSSFKKEKDQLVGQLKGGSGNSKSDLGLKKGGLESSEKKLALKSGQPRAYPAKSSTGSLRIAEKAQGSKSIEELNCIAHWSLLAAEAASAGALEQAREMAGWGFDDWRRTKGCPSVKVTIPEVPAPVEANPQYKAYQYLVARIEKMVPPIVATQQKIKDLREIRKEVIVKKETLKIKEDRSTKEEEKKKIKEEEKSLEDLAEALNKEALEMEMQAKNFQNEVNKSRQIYDRIRQEPASASQLIENMDKRNP